MSRPKKNIWKRMLDETEAPVARKMYKILVLNGIIPNKAVGLLADCFSVEKDNMQACVVTNDQLAYRRTFNRTNSPDWEDEDEVGIIETTETKRYSVPQRPTTDKKGYA